jgi:GT2 family glycosyltransferase
MGNRLNAVAPQRPLSDVAFPVEPVGDLLMSLQTFTSPLEGSVTQPKKRGVSVVIVVWNAQAYVLECLSSLREYCANAYTEVIVVDNASTDGTAELVAQRFPEFKLIRNSENMGFAKANNIGMSESSGEYVCLVNSDVKFTNDCISPMIQYLKVHPETGLLGPKMMGGDGKTAFRSTLRFPTVWNMFCRALWLDVAFKGSSFFGGLLMTDFNHETTRPVEVLVGWFWVARWNSIQRVGMLNPQFFMYGEDIDWCYRFRKAGEEVVFFAEADAFHYGGASSSAAPARFYLEQTRANWRYFRMHHGLLAQAGFLATVTIHHALRLIGSCGVYLLSPSQRSETRARLKRSLMCLQWVGTLGFSH